MNLRASFTDIGAVCCVRAIGWRGRKVATECDICLAGDPAGGAVSGEGGGRHPDLEALDAHYADTHYADTHYAEANGGAEHINGSLHGGEGNGSLHGRDG